MSPPASASYTDVPCTDQHVPSTGSQESSNKQLTVAHPFTQLQSQVSFIPHSVSFSLVSDHVSQVLKFVPHTPSKITGAEHASSTQAPRHIHSYSFVTVFNTALKTSDEPASHKSPPVGAVSVAIVSADPHTPSSQVSCTEQLIVDPPFTHSQSQVSSIPHAVSF